MNHYSLKDVCKVNSDVGEDVFVGIKYENGNISVSFPLGYHLHSDKGEEGYRKDVLLLIKVLSRYCNQQKSEIQADASRFSDGVNFPIQAYLYVIRDFLDRGYYRETETQYTTGKRGKINWSRTIKTQRPYIQDNEAFYLNYITKNSQVDKDELITLVHEWCIYESFEKIGWLFTDYMPQNPNIEFQQSLFLSVINDKLRNTFNDHDRELFQNMIAIVNNLEDLNSATKYLFGTYRFEYVWEWMIDQVYGIENKKDYFPQTIWEISRPEHDKYDNTLLRPDTIMKCNNSNNTIYVLDAKYYRYGKTCEGKDLPDSASINKQITYGEYIVESDNFNNDGKEVYNAFLLPFDSKKDVFNNNPPIFDTPPNLYYVGTATSSWKGNTNAYEQIQGILIDVNHLMECSCGNSVGEKEKLAGAIDSAVEYYSKTRCKNISK